MKKLQTISQKNLFQERSKNFEILSIPRCSFMLSSNAYTLDV